MAQEVSHASWFQELCWNQANHSAEPTKQRMGTVTQKAVACRFFMGCMAGLNQEPRVEVRGALAVCLYCMGLKNYQYCSLICLIMCLKCHQNDVGKCLGLVAILAQAPTAG